jgi:hypothetical protein
MLKAFTVAKTGEVEGVVLSEDQVLRIAEEYANAGIREMKEELVDQPGQPLWNLEAAPIDHGRRRGRPSQR